MQSLLSDDALTRDIDRTLEELERAIGMDATDVSYLERCLSEALRYLGAAWGVVCIRPGELPWRVLASREASETTGASRNYIDRLPWARLTPLQSDDAPLQTLDTVDCPLLVKAIRVTPQQHALFAIGWDTAPKAYPAWGLGLVQAFAELIGRSLLLYEYRRLEAREQAWRAQQHLVDSLQKEIHVERLAFRLAHDGQRHVGCDRLLVAVRRHGHFRVVAVSGVEAAPARTALRMKLDRLIDLVARWGETCTLSTPPEQDLPPEIEQAWSDYQDIACDRQSLFLPLKTSDSPSTVVGMLVASGVHEPLTSVAHDRLRQLVPSAEVALERALQLAPFYPWIAAWQRTKLTFQNRSRRAQTIFWSSLVACMLFLPWIVTTDLTILARGELQPTQLTHLFAPEEGVVDEVLVRDGQHVEISTPLIRLRSHRLELDAERIAGEIRTVQEQLAVTAASRRSATARATAEPIPSQQLSADERELQGRLHNLQQQQSIVATQIEQMTIVSPCAATVVTWNIEQLLRSRPVSRGQRLLTLADLQGPWHIDLRIPDRQMGHVQRYHQSHPADQQVSWVTTANPEQVNQGQLQQLSPATEVPQDQQAYVMGRVTFPATPLTDPRPGAEVVARVHCGRCSLGYAWLHGLYEEIVRRLF